MNTSNSNTNLSKSFVGRQRFVAFIDILGFRNLLIRSPDLDEFVKKYTNVFKPLKNEIQTLGIKHVLFSDSLFLAVDNRSLDEQLKSLVLFSKKLISRSIDSGLPVRGSISYGNVLWDGDIVVGMPIIEAVEQESIQDWIGIILSPNCMDYCVKQGEIISQLVAERLIIKYDKIPIKNSNEVLMGYAINFIYKGDKKENILASLETMSLLSGSIEAQKKYTETEKYINFLFDSIWRS